MSLSPGTRLGAYEIVSLIGAGGMGEVYRAHDSRLGRDVAVKVLPASVAGAASGAGAAGTPVAGTPGSQPQEERRARFEREARAVASLSHPNILAVHEFGSHDGHPFVVMELLEGQTLRDRLSEGGLPVCKAVAIATDVARGLSAAHEKQLIHRDRKPENIFLTNDGAAKILDFGLAKVVGGYPGSEDPGLHGAPGGHNGSLGATMAAAVVPTTLPFGVSMESTVVAPDGRTIFVGDDLVEATVWKVESGKK